MALHLDISKLRIKDYSSLKSRLTKLRNKPLPPFEGYKEDIEALKKIVKKYGRFSNLLVIGNGGSNTSFKAFHQALVPASFEKKKFIVTTMEPDLLKQLRGKYPKRNTLVMPISKSGTTIGVLEAMFAFEDYKMLPVTTPKTGRCLSSQRRRAST